MPVSPKRQAELRDPLKEKLEALVNRWLKDYAAKVEEVQRLDRVRFDDQIRILESRLDTLESRG